VTSFVELTQRRGVTMTTKNTCRIETKIGNNLTTVLLKFCRKVLSLCLIGCRFVK
jgi:hypothetical protein